MVRRYAIYRRCELIVIIAIAVAAVVALAMVMAAAMMAIMMMIMMAATTVSTGHLLQILFVQFDEFVVRYLIVVFVA